MPEFTPELYWLTLTVLMTALFWLTYILDRFVVRGIVPAIASRKPETGAPHSLWAQRAIRAHQNAVENLVIFVPAVLVANLIHLSTPITRMAVIVYFFARLAHFAVYTAGVPYLRTVAFSAGWAAQIAILGSILGWM